MNSLRKVDHRHFLQWVSAEYGERVRDRCLQELRQNPEADPYCVLDKARVAAHGVPAPLNMGNMTFGW